MTAVSETVILNDTALNHVSLDYPPNYPSASCMLTQLKGASHCTQAIFTDVKIIAFLGGQLGQVVS